MRQALALLFLFSGLSLFAQHTATIASGSDFKTISDGMVKTEFVLSENLSASELEEISAWVSPMQSDMVLTVNGTSVTVLVSPKYNDRNIYDKMFIQMGISAVVMTVNGTAKTMSVSEFLDHIQL